MSSRMLLDSESDSLETDLTLLRELDSSERLTSFASLLEELDLFLLTLNIFLSESLEIDSRSELD